MVIPDLSQQFSQTSDLLRRAVHQRRLVVELRVHLRDLASAVRGGEER